MKTSQAKRLKELEKENQRLVNHKRVERIWSGSGERRV